MYLHSSWVPLKESSQVIHSRLRLPQHVQGSSKWSGWSFFGPTNISARGNPAQAISIYYCVIVHIKTDAYSFFGNCLAF